MNARILVAGVGNIFLGDDGRLSLAERVTVSDFGIRGMHLAYQLLDDFGLVVLVDAVSRGGAPGTLYVIEPEVDGITSGASDESIADAHDMVLEHVFAQVRALGGKLGRVLIIGCEVEDVSEHIGLSDAMLCAVDEAVRVILELIGSNASNLTTENERPHEPGIPKEA